MTVGTYYVFDHGTEDLDDWIKVEGEGLPQPISVKVRSVAGELTIVGVRIDDGRPVKSADLRAVRLGALVDQLQAHLRDLAAWFLEDAREASREMEFYGVHATGTTEAEPDPLTPEGHAVVRMREAWDDYDRLAKWHRREPDLGEEATLARGRGASPPSAVELRRFAAVFTDEKTKRQRGAVTRTARRIGVDRSTAHRWINHCKRQGVLPIEQEGHQ